MCGPPASMRLHYVIASLALLAVSLKAPAQEGCQRCDHQGVVACKKHKNGLLEAEARVHFCSIAAACPDCQGTLTVDCRHCDGGPGVERMAERRREIQAWLESSEVAKHFGRSVPRCQSEHLELVFETGRKIKDGRKVIDPHELMHQVADDCEHVASRIVEHFDVVEDGETKGNGFPAKMRMWLWSNPDDHASALETFLSTSARGDFKLLGRDPVFSVWQEPGFFATAPRIRSVFSHNMGHMLISNLERELDIGVTGGGWFDAGLAHWYEYERFKRSVIYCFEEASLPDKFANGVWKASMRKLVAKSEGGLFVPLLSKPTTAMSAQEQAVCWSLYDWLVAIHPAKLRPILTGLKAKVPTREIFKEHLGATTLEAEAAWKAWVMETYPKKDPTRRR